MNKHWGHATATENLNIYLVIRLTEWPFAPKSQNTGLKTRAVLVGLVSHLKSSRLWSSKANLGKAVSCFVRNLGVWRRRAGQQEAVPCFAGWPVGEREKRECDTLFPLIQQYILSGSVIKSDQWRAYSTLNDHGYTHLAVNNSAISLHPTDPLIHSKNIENLWRDVNEWMKRPEPGFTNA